MDQSAKEMYFAYQCSEYNMKMDDVLDRWVGYHIPMEQQKQWKNEYIDGLFQTFERSRDQGVLSQISGFSRDTANTYILARLIEIWKTADKSEIEVEAWLTFLLMNAFNPFTIARKDVVAIEAAEIVEDSCKRILSGNASERTCKIAGKCLKTVEKWKRK